MPSLTADRLSCSECGADAVEVCGTVQRCRCGCRKFEPDSEGAEEALRHRCAKLEAALLRLIAASRAHLQDGKPWALTLAAYKAGDVLAGRAE